MVEQIMFLGSVAVGLRRIEPCKVMVVPPNCEVLPPPLTTLLTTDLMLTMHCFDSLNDVRLLILVMSYLCISVTQLATVTIATPLML